ncbi:similar to C6 transcription factor [Plenodomus lingam JN3]|uniref:Similar to C6 transcription factor n=1 Tax=Leptosphaeria maculans (strain JN3 / isolate v23.1.3 / race Av1-4-5-6-7-8) TaxID=985895 RepID=E5A249_LEPMJ|nr:similar to C6 transcription factor [Plenodomus lingam JN3]CBX97926.1 similar to C6 transcription factor [Plenodomus lingam JN3]
MDATATNANGGASHPHVASPNDTAKHSQQSAEDHHDWSGEDASSADEAHDRSQSGAPSKRKRPLSVSCETCKQRKVKCDRGAPACSWCVKNNSACVYLPRKKPGLRAGYGRELEARLGLAKSRAYEIYFNDKLEHALAQQQAQINHLSTASIATSSPHEINTFRSPPVIQTPHIPRPETALFIQKPNATFPSQNAIQNQFGVTDGRPTPSVTGNGYGQSDDIHAGLSSMHRDSYTPSFNNDQFHPTMSRALGQSEVDFPPYDLLYGLVDLFFKHIYPWCPILHRQTTLNSLFGDTTLDEADRIILHAVVATTVRFSTDQRLTPEKRARYHQSSKEKVLLYGIENSSVKSLQALVILALDVVGCSNGPPGWNLLALITRSVVQLGLSVEKFSPSVAPQYASIYTLRAIVLPEPKDWIEEESRRRLFWMIYVLDRYATVATAFEFALDEDEVDRKLPCRDDMFARNLPVDTRWFHTSTRTDYSMDRPENLGPFSYYIEILGLLTRIHKFLKKPVDITSLSDVEKWQSEYRELDNAIEQWKYNLPQEFGNSARVFAKSNGMNQTLNSGMVMLHAAYHTTIIRLHSSAAYPTHRSPIFTPSFSASQRCLSAVESITALCACVRDNGLLSKLGPPFAFSLWVAARVLLVHGSTIDHRVDSSIDLLVRTLQEFGQYWEVGTRYANLLSRVLSEYQESQQTPAGVNGERVTPSTVKILADMRRCAFDLDFLISRQPRLNARLPSVTPARTPAPNELEYLDVFDFFNMPRLPVSMDGAMSYAAQDGSMQLQEGGYGNESNITNYMVDASSDWFIKQSS